MVEVTPKSASINEVPGAGMEEANGLNESLVFKFFTLVNQENTSKM